MYGENRGTSVGTQKTTSELILSAQEARRAAEQEVENLLSRSLPGKRVAVNMPSSKYQAPDGLDTAVESRLAASRYNPSPYVGSSIRDSSTSRREHRDVGLGFGYRDELHAAALEMEALESERSRVRRLHGQDTVLPPRPPFSSIAAEEMALREADRLASLESARRAMAQQAASAVTLLEDENLRLVQAKTATEIDRDRLEVEALQLKNTLTEHENNSRRATREAEIECEAKDRLAQRLLSELHETQSTLQVTRKDAQQSKDALQSTREELSATNSDLDTEKSCTAALNEQLAVANEKIASLEAQCGLEAELRAKSTKNMKGLVEIAAHMGASLKIAQQHARDCSARGYFATKSLKVHDNFASVLDRLVDLATRMDKDQTRKQIMSRIKKVEEAIGS